MWLGSAPYCGGCVNSGLILILKCKHTSSLSLPMFGKINQKLEKTFAQIKL